MTFERVYAVTNFHDRVRDGVADLEGVPHFFQAEWDDAADDYASTFRLTPIQTEAVALAVEHDALWERWWIEVRKDPAQGGQIPRPLPDDRAKHKELQEALKQVLRIDPNNFTRARAEFRTRFGWNGVGFAPLEVRWERV